MSDNRPLRIDVDAAKALISWKSLFAGEVTAIAKRLAADSGQPDHVTLAHYRIAALAAIRSLSEAVVETGAAS